MSNDFWKSMFLLESLSSDSKTKKEIKRENKIKKQIIENNRKMISLNDEIISSSDELISANKEIIDNQAKTIDYFEELIEDYIDFAKTIGKNINDGIDLLESTKLHSDVLKKREKFLNVLKEYANNFPSTSPESFDKCNEISNNYIIAYNEFIKEIEDYNDKVINEK